MPNPEIGCGYNSDLCGGCSSVGRVQDCDSCRRGFESRQPPHTPLSTARLAGLFAGRRGAAILRAGTSGLVRAACVGWRTLRAGAPIAFKFHARDHQYITVFHCEQLSEQLTPTAMIFCFHDFRIRLLYTFPAGLSSPKRPRPSKACLATRHTGGGTGSLQGGASRAQRVFPGNRVG